jgi:hypothetical protein
MKYILQTLLITLIVLIYSCKKDPATIYSPVGVWHMSEMSCDDGVDTFIMNGTIYPKTFKIVGDEYDAALVITNDSTYFSTNGYREYRITLAPSSVPFKYDRRNPNPMFPDGTWTQKNNQLTFYSSLGFNCIIDVLELTDTKLRFKTIVTEASDVYNTDYYIFKQGTYYFTYTK